MINSCIANTTGDATSNNSNNANLEVFLDKKDGFLDSVNSPNVLIVELNVILFLIDEISNVQDSLTSL